MSIKRGALIVIEGLDRSGKSTQCKKLVKALNSKNIHTELMNFPDRSTVTGKLIDQYLKNNECKINDQAIHLLFSANRWENLEKMMSLLKNGVTLVIDRYSYSGIVFSAVKKVMSVDWCKCPENGLPKPDLVFLLTLSTEEMLKRPGFGNERYENSEFQENVADMYDQLCKEEENWIKINASRTVDEVHSEILEACLKKIDLVGNMPLGTFNYNSDTS